MNGTIYLITNNKNDKKYVGQTSRDIDVRFDEHAADDKDSLIHKAMEEYGWRNFKIEPLEIVPINELDKAEEKWISFYNTYETGYNKRPSGVYIDNNGINLYVIEKNIYIKSIDYFAEKCFDIVRWNKDSTKQNLEISCNTGKQYLGYHFKKVHVSENDFVFDDVLSDWIKTLKKINCSKCVYSPELDIEFTNVNEAVKYCLNNMRYSTKNKFPDQELKTFITKMLLRKIEDIPNMEDIHFIERYCPKIDYDS